MPTQFVLGRIETPRAFRRVLQCFTFSSDYQPKQDVPIAKCATAYTCPDSGASVVLVADQVLWFGDELHCSLINPHQIRSHGFSVCDDPWDPHRALGIDLTPFSYLLSHRVRIFNLNLACLRTGRYPISDHRHHCSYMESRGPTHVWAAFDYDACCRLYIDRSAGYMVPFDSTLAAISLALDSRCVSSLYANAVLVHGALTGTTNAENAEISATFTSERHSSVNFENLSRNGISALKRPSELYR
ncbi:Reverse transcriptase (RNA-dependent DNA polymerase) [Fragilaria crotonensis]|nr:Reverse transcriptase (RNA-dependent DNA polymerase) [Fragilaria crotonensis]